MPKVRGFKVQTEREADGRWIADVPALPGAMAYSETRDEAIAKIQALALRVLAERIEGWSGPLHRACVGLDD